VNTPDTPAGDDPAGDREAETIGEERTAMRNGNGEKSAQRKRAAPIWEDGGIRVFAPKGKRQYHRILGYLADGTRVDTTGGRTRDAAIAAAKEILAQDRPGAGDRTARPLRDLLAEFTDPDNHAGAWSQRHADNVAGLLRNHVPAETLDRQCRSLRPGDFEKVLNTMRKSSYAPRTVERVGATLRAAVTYGRKHGYFDQGFDPMFGVSYGAGGRSRRREARTAANELWVPEAARPGMDDKDRLADAMREVTGLDWWWLATHVAGEMGLRWGELIRVDPDHVDLDAGVIHVPRQWSETDTGTFEDKLPKMERERTVPFPEWMTDDLAQRCEQVEQAHTHTFRSGRSRNEHRLLFCTREGRIPRRSNWNRRAITPARLLAQWPHRTSKDEDGRIVYDWVWTWHSLRHLFCSHAVSKDGLDLDPEVAARLAGHTPDVFRRMYVDAPPDHLALARTAMKKSQRPGI